MSNLKTHKVNLTASYKKIPNLSLTNTIKNIALTGTQSKKKKYIKFKQPTTITRQWTYTA
jgi:hypothetical protein